LRRYIKDELDENLTINNVRLIIGEWIPMVGAYTRPFGS
jgi:hypothetical protein